MEDEFTFDYLPPLTAEDARALQARAADELPEGEQRSKLIARFERIERIYAANGE